VHLRTLLSVVWLENTNMMAMKHDRIV